MEGAKGAAAPPPPQPTKKRREGGERKRGRKKKEKRGFKRRRKLNQSFHEHVFMGLYSDPQTPDGPQTPDCNGVSISRLASAPLFTKSCLRPGRCELTPTHSGLTVNVSL